MEKTSIDGHGLAGRVDPHAGGPWWAGPDRRMTGEVAEPTFSEREVRTVALAIIAGLVFGGVATGVAFPTLPLLDELLGISAIMLGAILSANRVVRLPLNAPAGNIIDRVGARRPMIVGLFVQAGAPFGYLAGMNVPDGTVLVLPAIGPVSTAAAVFLGARAMWGVGSAFVFLGAFATITHVTTTENRGRWLGYMRGGQSLGFPSGLILGGLVADLLHPQAAFLLAGVLALLAGLVASSVLPDVDPETDERARIRDIPGMIRREPRIFPIGAGNFTIRFLFGGVLLATVAKYAEAYGLHFTLLSATGVSGMVLAVGVLSSGGSTFVAGRLSDELRNRALITVPAFAIMALGVGLLAVVPTLAGLFIGTALIGVGTGATGPALSAILGDITPGTELGRMGGVYNFMGDVGSTLGPLLAIPLVDVWLDFPTTYLGCMLLVVCTGVVVAVPLLRWDVEPLPDPVK